MGVGLPHRRAAGVAGADLGRAPAPAAPRCPGTGGRAAKAPLLPRQPSGACGTGAEEASMARSPVAGGLLAGRGGRRGSGEPTGSRHIRRASAVRGLSGSRPLRLHTNARWIMSIHLQFNKDVS